MITNTLAMLYVVICGGKLIGVMTCGADAAALAKRHAGCTVTRCWLNSCVDD